MKIVECPRDAMQGLQEFIPTAKKVQYINQLLQVGFDTIDFGSFVSVQAVPQMKDTAQVLAGLDTSQSSSKLLAIVANERGAREAAQFPSIDYLGFPLSLSETFQQRNTNRTIREALDTLQVIQDQCLRHEKQSVTYLSMGFGNPYGDPYDRESVISLVERLDLMGIGIISLSDTIGVSTPENITYLFQSLIPAFPQIEFGAHLHSHPARATEKIAAAYNAGCRRFDGALKGYGGCPMANDDLVGNMATEHMIGYLKTRGEDLHLYHASLKKAIDMLDDVFPH